MAEHKALFDCGRALLRSRAAMALSAAALKRWRDGVLDGALDVLIADASPDVDLNLAPAPLPRQLPPPAPSPSPPPASVRAFFLEERKGSWKAS